MGDLPATSRLTDVPQPGALDIRLRRSWPTWMLVVGVLGGILVGTVIGHSGASSASQVAQKSYVPPPPADSTPTSVPAGATSTTVGAATAASSGPDATATTTSAPTGPVVVLVPRYESSAASWTSRVFTIAGGTWNIGWAFRCSPPPNAGPGFSVAVVASGASSGSSGAPTPAVTQSAPSGQGVAPQTTAGPQTIQVTAAPGCVWAVQVTGIGS